MRLPFAKESSQVCFPMVLNALDRLHVVVIIDSFAGSSDPAAQKCFLRLQIKNIIEILPGRALLDGQCNAFAETNASG